MKALIFLKKTTTAKIKHANSAVLIKFTYCAKLLHKRERYNPFFVNNDWFNLQITLLYMNCFTMLSAFAHYS